MTSSTNDSVPPPEPGDLNGGTDTVAPADLAVDQRDIEDWRRTALSEMDHLRAFGACILMLVGLSLIVGPTWAASNSFDRVFDRLLPPSGRPGPVVNEDLLRWMFAAKAAFLVSVFGVGLALLRSAQKLVRPLWLPAEISGSDSKAPSTPALLRLLEQVLGTKND